MHMSQNHRFAPRLEALEPREVPSVYHVATDGNDSGPGTEEDPWRTLQRAANVVQAGDDVLVRPGNYVGFDLRRSGSDVNPIRFLAEWGTVIDTRNARTPDGINLE